MLTSFRNTQTEVLGKLAFGGTKTLPVPSGGVFLNIPVFYARESVKTITQKGKEHYPRCSIYDYFPEYDTEWNPNFKETVDGLHDIDPITGLFTKGYLYKEPLRFLLRYDMTIYVNHPLQRYDVMDFMEKTYSKTGVWVLNETLLPEGPVGDFVTYNMSPTENERTDGIFELNYEFNIKPFINLTDPKEINLITNFNLNINPVNP